jgi:hypothetical protein
MENAIVVSPRMVRACENTGRYREVTHGPKADTANILDMVRWMRNGTATTA